MTVRNESGQPARELSIAGRVAIVTGAATGLGAAIAQALSQAGVLVVMADVDRFLACALADTIDPQRERSLVVTCDVARAEDCETVVRMAVARFGGIDILVNCAGTEMTRPLHALAVDEWNRVLGTNLRGPFLLGAAARNELLAGFDGAGGHIVNVSSTGAASGWASPSAHQASRLGLLGFSHSLHAELAQFGIRVSSVIDGGGDLALLPPHFRTFDHGHLQDPGNVAIAVLSALRTPTHATVPEVMVLPSPRAAEQVSAPLL